MGGKIEQVFLQIVAETDLGGGKTEYRKVREAIGKRMTDKEFKGIMEFLCNIGAICACNWPGVTFERSCPGCSKIESLSVEINKKNKFVIEGGVFVD